MDFNSARLEVEKANFKFWFLDEFDDDKSASSILGEMPGLEEFEKKKVVIQKELNKVTPELRQFYCEPLLNKAQEFHLFRKMNYLKYRASRHYKWYLRSSLQKMKQTFINCLEEAQFIRNKIVCCNTRLAAQVYKKRKDFYGDDVDNLLSDCFTNIIKAVDGFDFRRGFKFSTYCTWVLMNNSLRDHQGDKKFQENFATNVTDASLTNMIDNASFNEDERREKATTIASDIAVIFQKLFEKDEREAEILSEYFGIKDGKKKTLKEISEAMDITKERVRQIRNSALSYIQNLVATGSISIKSGDYLD
jgi:RNA polymerase primary sigma factor